VPCISVLFFTPYTLDSPLLHSPLFSSVIAKLSPAATSPVMLFTIHSPLLALCYPPHRIGTVAGHTAQKSPFFSFPRGVQTCNKTVSIPLSFPRCPYSYPFPSPKVCVLPLPPTRRYSLVIPGSLPRCPPIENRQALLPFLELFPSFPPPSSL